MKKLLLFATLAIASLWPSTILALTFNDGDKIYNLKEVDIKCNLDNLSYTTIGKNNNFIYENNEDGNNQIKILDDGTCSNLEGQELLDYYNGIGNTYYGIEKDNNGNYVIINYTYEGVERKNILIPTRDEEIISEKEYYEIEIGDGSFSSGPATSGNIENYYELVNLMRLKNIKQDKTKQYYEIYDFDYAREVTDSEYDESKAINYYVLSDGSVKETSTPAVTLPEIFKQLLARARYWTIKSPIEDTYYIIVSQQGETKWTVYDTKGNAIFEDIDSMVIVNSLFAVTNNNATKFYNLGKELVYELEESSVTASKVYGNISVIIGKKEQKDTLYLLELEENKPKSLDNISNPKTADNIITSFVLAILSLISIGGTAIYLKKRKS